MQESLLHKLRLVHHGGPTGLLALNVGHGLALVVCVLHA